MDAHSEAVPLNFVAEEEGLAFKSWPRNLLATIPPKQVSHSPATGEPSCRTSIRWHICLGARISHCALRLSIPIGEKPPRSELILCSRWKSSRSSLLPH